MGRHAFTETPYHGRVYDCLKPLAPPHLLGVEARWNMPAARHVASLGDDADFPAVDHYVATLHIGGGSVRRVDAARFSGGVATTGALSLQRPGSGGSFRSVDRVDYAHFYFQPGLLEEVSEEMGDAGHLVPDDFFACRSIETERQARAYLARAAHPNDPPTSIEMDSRAYLLVVELLRLVHGRRAIAAGAATAPAAPRLDPVFDLIEARLGDSLRLADLSGAVGYSPFHFARLFRRATGETPSAYLMRRRCERAYELIVGSRQGLAEIAYLTGFSSQSHMTQRIRQRYGATPRRLRG